MIRSSFFRIEKKSVISLFILISFVSLLMKPLTCAAEAYFESGVNSKPTRIVVFPLFAEEILLEMVGPDRIIFVGHPYIENGESYSPTMELSRNIPGSNWTMCDESEFLSLDPDLIILSSDLIDAYEQGSLFPKLAKEDIPVIFLDSPRDFVGVKNCIWELGEVVGETEIATEMILKTETKMQHIEELISTIAKNDTLKVVYYDPWQESFFDAARFCNACSPYGADVSFVAIDDTFVAEWNPDVLFFNPVWLDTDGSILEIGGQYAESIYYALLNNPHLQSVDAVKNRRIYPINLHSSQYFVDTVWSIMRSIYHNSEP